LRSIRSDRKTAIAGGIHRYAYKQRVLFFHYDE
jgi:hypothetical protein